MLPEIKAQGVGRWIELEFLEPQGFLWQRGTFPRRVSIWNLFLEIIRFSRSWSVPSNGVVLHWDHWTCTGFFELHDIRNPFCLPGKSSLFDFQLQLKASCMHLGDGSTPKNYLSQLTLQRKQVLPESPPQTTNVSSKSSALLQVLWFNAALALSGLFCSLFNILRQVRAVMNPNPPWLKDLYEFHSSLC